MRVVIVEDQALFREFLAMLVSQQMGHDLIAEAEDGITALDIIRTTPPDLVILDILIPELSGIRVAQVVKEAFPSVRLLALSSELDAKTVHQVHSLGIHGFVDKKEASVDVLREAIQTVGNSGRFYSEAVRMAVRRLQTDPNAFQKILSPREQQVLSLVGGAHDNSEISSLLGISESSAQSHRQNLLRKLNVHSTPELIRYAHEKGFWKAGFTKMGLRDSYHAR